MSRNTPRRDRIRLPMAQALSLTGTWAGSRIREQVPPVLLMTAYLVLFQTLVLGLPLSGALGMAGGIAMVILGLAAFIEGLSLGLMPLGEGIGLRLPRVAPAAVVLAFAFILGLLATLAEPAAASLKLAGSSVRAWESPVLFALLNRHGMVLLGAIGLGVGLGVTLSLVRFYLGWSLKLLVLLVLPACLALSILAALDPRLASLVALAWDSGAITTGPVTVPLVLALGLGTSRVLSKDDSALAGFGLVTMASLMPVLTVLAAGLLLSPGLPAPMTEQEFASEDHRSEVRALFDSPSGMDAWMQAHVDPAFLTAPSPESPQPPGEEDRVKAAELPTWLRILLTSVQAVLPLALFLLIALVLSGSRPARGDETALGIVLALGGMLLLNAGLETGLSPLGNSVGTGLTSTIQAMEMPGSSREVKGFDTSVIYRTINLEGQVKEWFRLETPGESREIPFDASRLDPDGTYRIFDSRGPFLGSRAAGLGILLVFAFLMGYVATMSEPALSTMGKTVEDITVGTFPRKRLMQSVALGVGIGVAVGIIKLLTGIHLLWFLLPPCLVILVLTVVSDETLVNIAWDSAGVTTGPVTVPLVLAMGLGLGNQLGLPEGFGILALASAFPILSVLLAGLLRGLRQRRLLEEDPHGE